MNIFEMSDEEFEKYLKDKFDNINPEILLEKLIECGLIIEDESNLNIGDRVLIAETVELTEIIAISYDENKEKIYTVKGSVKDYYEKDLIRFL